jgi:hypothetical protein
MLPAVDSGRLRTAKAAKVAGAVSLEALVTVLAGQSIGSVGGTDMVGFGLGGLEAGLADGWAG